MKKSARKILVVIILVGLIILGVLTFFSMKNHNALREKILVVAKEEIQTIKILREEDELYIGYGKFSESGNGCYYYSIDREGYNGYVLVERDANSHNEVEYKYGIYITSKNEGIRLTKEEDLEKALMQRLKSTKKPNGTNSDIWNSKKLVTKDTNDKDKQFCIKINKKIYESY